MDNEEGDIVARANGRARYLRDKGEVKSPALFDHLAAELTRLRIDLAEAREAMRAQDNLAAVAAQNLTNLAIELADAQRELARINAILVLRTRRMLANGVRAAHAEHDHDAAKAEAERLRKAALHARDSMKGGMKVLAAQGLEDGYAWAALMLAIKNINAALQEREKPHG